MNKVSFLLNNKFTQFCTDDQLKIKALGRDMPDLNITKYSLSQNDKGTPRSRKFNRTLYAKNSWICGCEETNKMYCFPCVLYGGDEYWSEKGVDDLIHVWEKIKSHERTSRHMNNMFSLNILGKVDIKILLNSSLRAELLKLNEQVRANRHDLDKIISNIRFSNAFDLALRGHDQSETIDNVSCKGFINFEQELEQCTKDQLEKFPFFKGQVQNVINELIECSYGIYRDEIIKQVKNADYLSVIVDETSDFSCKSQLIVILRYLANGKPLERFWNILYPDAFNAEAISDCIIQEIEPLVGQTPDKLVSISYDGPSVVSGSLSIIHAKLSEKFPSCVYVHYYAHSVNLILSSAAAINKQAKIFFSSLCSLCSFISTSPQVIGILNDIVKKRNPSKITWDFDVAASGVKTIHEHRKDLVMVMDYLEKSANDATVNQAGGYKFRLQDKEFIFWLGIFNKVLPQAVNIFKLVQKEGVDSNTKNEALKRFENAMFGIQQQMDVLISEIENEINSSISLDDDEDLEEKPLKKPRLLNHQKRREEAMEVCNAIIRHVHVRFNSVVGYLNATSLFKVNNFKEYRMTFPTRYLDDAVKQFSFIDKQKITAELQVVYERPELRVISGVVPLLALVSDNDLETTFQELVKILSVLSTMPMETSESERRFFTLKQIQTFFRNTMQTRHLNALASLSVEKGFINDIDDFNHKVINLFATKTKRLEFVYRKV
ncbi:hypothetical protein ABEB36_011941 [Hypothenemus hampei]|uniref:Zinc finger MYM-type protein 1-like n=1 Tax=Hypothenemus hampei TaxID=57062 RepID=A0ABD1E9T4_HYPHA